MCHPAVLLSLLCLSCTFDGSGIEGSVPGQDARAGAQDSSTSKERHDALTRRDTAASRDSSVPRSDGADASAGDVLDAAPEQVCGWPFRPEYFDRCNDPVPAGSALTLSSGAFVYDTDSGLLSHTSAEVSSPPSSIVNEARVIWVTSFVVSGAATLRATGSRPLMVVSTGDMTIDGSIDVSSSTRTAGDFDLGAGAIADPSSCSSPPLAGTRCGKHGASGGGGGGFAIAGGAGDGGGKGHDCGDGDSDGKPPTSGGAPIEGLAGQIRGGCAGAPGDFTDEDGAVIEDRGEGGPGGGALHLTARGVLTVRGTLHAGGAGGRPGSDHRASGGGGGSGGYIGLESNDLRVQQSAVLAANGGGGGGGCDNPTGLAGADGTPFATAAAGGAAQGDGGEGNDGAYLSVAPGTADAAGKRGGGGGGGGVGFIVFYAPGQSHIDVGATISPPQTLGR
jgi:hypothetical protein